MSEDEIRDELWPNEKVVARVSDLVKEIDETEARLHKLIQLLQLYLIAETDRGRQQIQQMIKKYKFEKEMEIGVLSCFRTIELAS